MAHSKSSFSRITTLAVTFAGFGLISAPAHAGFEWNPGPKAGTQAAAPVAPGTDMPPLPPMPSEKVESNDLTRTPPLPPLPTPPLPVTEISARPEAAPVKPSFAETVKAPAVEAPIVAEPKSASALPDAVGFGSDLPLALGMRQIVPAQYAYAFDTGVDQGAKISWNGGKPWDQALSEALKPLGYNATVEGTTVHVSSGAVAPKAEIVPASTQPTMAMHAGGDMPRPPLSPAETAAPAVETAATPAADKSVREVYVRRNADGDKVEQRAAGKSEVAQTKKSSVDTINGNNGDKPGFWSRVNPMNWQEGPDKKPTPYTVNRTAGDVSTSKEVPPPSSYSKTPDVGPVARMSDKDARIDGGKPSRVQADHAPSAPDDVADEVTSSSAPVVLTHGPGEISQPAVTPPVVKTEKVAAPANEPILDTAEIATWEAKKGESLKTVLQQWSEKAKVQLYWVPAQDYKLPKPVHLQGNYTDAVSDVLSAYGDKGSRPVGRLHPNLPNGPSVLIIEPAAS